MAATVLAIDMLCLNWTVVCLVLCVTCDLCALPISLRLRTVPARLSVRCPNYRKRWTDWKVDHAWHGLCLRLVWRHVLHCVLDIVHGSLGTQTHYIIHYIIHCLSSSIYCLAWNILSFQSTNKNYMHSWLWYFLKHFIWIFLIPTSKVVLCDERWEYYRWYYHHLNTSQPI